ncbi:MAG TPA: hypothetical protein VEK07_19710 [Polyangiaceae bacterium]|nr:hypothetical protein [Polyangiaceae bacterium]
MSNSLRGRLNALASSFASSVLEVIRGVSLDQLIAESSSGRARKGGPAAPVRAAAPTGAGPRRRGRLPRRSAGDIERVVDRIVGLLKRHPGGLRAEEIRDQLGLEAKELPRPLKEALDTGSLQKSGQKRATTYFVKTAGGGSKTAGGRVARRGGRGGARASASARKARATSATGRASAKKVVESSDAVAPEQPAQGS